MIIYANTELTANRVAEMMKNEEPEFAKNVQIEKISKDAAPGSFIIFNKTKDVQNKNFIH